MVAIDTPIAEHQPERPIAPGWHTLLVLAVLLIISGASKVLPQFAAGFRARGHVVTYTFMICVEWATLLIVWYGVHNRLRLGELIGGEWLRPWIVLRDVGIAIAYLIVANLILILTVHILKAKPTEAMKRLLPQGRTEVLLWILLSLSAGICEEIVFRGYLRRQFTAFTRNATFGVIAQGLIFGAAHGYQGWRYMVVIAVYGCLFGVLAVWRRSLRPGMVAHFMQDSIAAFARHTG
jgi:uncharacterized protein